MNFLYWFAVLRFLLLKYRVNWLPVNGRKRQNQPLLWILGLRLLTTIWTRMKNQYRDKEIIRMTHLVSENKKFKS